MRYAGFAREMVVSQLGTGLYCVFVLLWSLVVLCATAQPAYGYIDPGSGLFLFQVLGSTLAGAAFLVRKRIRQLLARFGKSSK